MEQVDFKEKLRSLGFAHKHRGSTKTQPVIREDNGKVGGLTTEHWDGSVDATVFAETATNKGSVNE